MEDPNQDYLTKYREFFENLVQNCDLSNPLLVNNIPKYNLTESEISGEILSWCLHYLNDRNCPTNLRAILCQKAYQEVIKYSKEQPELSGYRPKEDDFNSLKLVQVTIKKLVEMCEQYSDNALLSTLPPPPAERLFDPIISSCAVKNKRRKMEDRHLIVQDLHALFDLKDCGSASFYAVFDGHNGTDAATYSCAHLYQFIVENENYPHNPTKALYEAFQQTDERFTDKSKKNMNHLESGTTAVCVLLRPYEKKLYVAWLGDSQAILVSRGGICANLVLPHRPSRVDERERIEKEGGVVIFMGVHRVNGYLAVSRAIGDTKHKPYISSKPDIDTVNLTGEEEFMVIASDGLWDFMSPTGVMMAVKEYIAENKGPIDEVAKYLVQIAKVRSEDNISVVVVFLTEPERIINKMAPVVEVVDETPFIPVKTKKNRNKKKNRKIEVQEVQEVQKLEVEEPRLEPVMNEEQISVLWPQEHVGLNGGNEPSIFTTEEKNLNNDLNDINDLNEVIDDFPIMAAKASALVSQVKCMDNWLQKKLGETEQNFLQSLPWTYAQIVKNSPKKESDKESECDISTDSDKHDDFDNEDAITVVEVVEGILLDFEDKDQKKEKIKKSKDKSKAEDVNNDVADGEVESEDDSEEEWNYTPGKENRDPSAPEQSPDDDMSNLNPNAAEFVPVLSTLKETILASSPAKGAEQNLDNIKVPSNEDFLSEISQRPSELDNIFSNEKNFTATDSLIKPEIEENTNEQQTSSSGFDSESGNDEPDLTATDKNDLLTKNKIENNPFVESGELCFKDHFTHDMSGIQELNGIPEINGTEDKISKDESLIPNLESHQTPEVLSPFEHVEKVIEAPKSNPFDNDFMGGSDLMSQSFIETPVCFEDKSKDKVEDKNGVGDDFEFINPTEQDLTEMKQLNGHPETQNVVETEKLIQNFEKEELITPEIEQNHEISEVKHQVEDIKTETKESHVEPENKDELNLMTCLESQEITSPYEDIKFESNTNPFEINHSQISDFIGQSDVSEFHFAPEKVTETSKIEKLESPIEEPLQIPEIELTKPEEPETVEVEEINEIKTEHETEIPEQAEEVTEETKMEPAEIHEIKSEKIEDKVEKEIHVDIQEPVKFDDVKILDEVQEPVKIIDEVQEPIKILDEVQQSVEIIDEVKEPVKILDQNEEIKLECSNVDIESIKKIEIPETTSPAPTPAEESKDDIIAAAVSAAGVAVAGVAAVEALKTEEKSPPSTPMKKASPLAVKKPDPKAVAAKAAAKTTAAKPAPKPASTLTKKPATTTKAPTKPLSTASKPTTPTGKVAPKPASKPSSPTLKTTVAAKPAPKPSTTAAKPLTKPTAPAAKPAPKPAAPLAAKTTTAKPAAKPAGPLAAAKPAAPLAAAKARTTATKPPVKTEAKPLSRPTSATSKTSTSRPTSATSTTSTTAKPALKTTAKPTTTAPRPAAPKPPVTAVKTAPKAPTKPAVSSTVKAAPKPAPKAAVPASKTAAPKAVPKAAPTAIKKPLSNDKTIKETTNLKLIKTKTDKKTETKIIEEMSEQEATITTTNGHIENGVSNYDEPSPIQITQIGIVDALK